MKRPDPDLLLGACGWLSDRDPALARAFAAYGVPQWRIGAPDYAVIARMIAFQQITTKAAATIWARVETALGAVSTETILGASEDTLRTCGLSRPKIAHLRSIAAAVEKPPNDMPVSATRFVSTRPENRESAPPRASFSMQSTRKSMSAGRSLSICSRLERAPPGLTTAPSICVYRAEPGWSHAITQKPCDARNSVQ